MITPHLEVHLSDTGGIHLYWGNYDSVGAQSLNSVMFGLTTSYVQCRSSWQIVPRLIIVVVTPSEFLHFTSRFPAFHFPWLHGRP